MHNSSYSSRIRACPYDSYDMDAELLSRLLLGRTELTMEN